MLPYAVLLQPNLFHNLRRALDRVINADLTPVPRVLVACQSSSELSRWRCSADSDFGGQSQARLRWVADHDDRNHISFEGRISKAVTADSELIRSGFAGAFTLLNSQLDLSLHDTLSFSFRAHQPLTYLVSLRTGDVGQQVSGHTSWQLPLRPSRVGEWETVRLPQLAFRYTYKGRTYNENEGVFVRSARRNVVGSGIVISAADDMPEQFDFRLDVSHMRVEAEPLTQELIQDKLQNGQLYGEEENEWAEEKRAFEAARQLRTPGRER